MAGYTEKPRPRQLAAGDDFLPPPRWGRAGEGKKRRTHRRLFLDGSLPPPQPFPHSGGRVRLMSVRLVPVSRILLCGLQASRHDVAMVSPSPSTGEGRGGGEASDSPQAFPRWQLLPHPNPFPIRLLCLHPVPVSLDALAGPEPASLSGCWPPPPYWNWLSGRLP